MNNLIKKLYHHPFLSRVFHTTVYCLKRELKDCESVLDIGCGPSSPLQYCQNIRYSVGVEPFIPYLNKSKKRKIHTKYLAKKIEELDFAKNSFDAVILIEVLEHLPKETGRKILKKVEKWAKKKVVVSTPNGLFPMGKVDDNPWQEHLSGWTMFELRKLGFRCYGQAGVKFFYKPRNAVESLMVEAESVAFTNMRFKPRKLFYFINSLFQIVTYHIPEAGFELFAVKEKNV